MKTTDTPAIEAATPVQAALYQQLRGRLAHLKLADAAEALPGVLDAARADGMSLTAALEHLLRIEVDAVEARKLAGRLRFACLPTPATLSDLDYDASGSLDRKLVEELATCRYLDTATNVLDVHRVADPEQRPAKDEVAAQCRSAMWTTNPPSHSGACWRRASRRSPSCTVPAEIGRSPVGVDFLVIDRDATRVCRWLIASP